MPLQHILWSHCNTNEDNLAPLGNYMDNIWAPLHTTWRPLGTWCHLGVTWCHLVVTWVPLRCHLGVLWVSLGCHLGVTGLLIDYWGNVSLLCWQHMAISFPPFPHFEYLKRRRLVVFLPLNHLSMKASS